MIQVDVWSGKLSQDHVARYICEIDDPRIKRDLEQGCLLNLLRLSDMQGGSWRDTDAFDFRTKQ